MNYVFLNVTGFDDDDFLAPNQNLTIFSRLADVFFPNGLEFDNLAPSDDIIQITPSIKSPTDDTTFTTEFGSTYNLERATVIEIGNSDDNINIDGDGYTKITVHSLFTGFVFTIAENNDTRRVLPCPGLDPDDMHTVYDRDGNFDEQLLIQYFDLFNDENDKPTLPALSDERACHIGQDIYTTHFSGFGSARSSTGGGGGGCEECTAPTLGYNSRGQKLVSGGFSYNGNPTDVEYFFTPYPLITTEVGVENVATFKIYDNQGPDYIMHFSMAFGLRAGDVISQSKAMIEYDIDFQGNGTITITDPENAIENDTVRILTDTVACTPEASYDCLEITIHHTFRAPLDFDIVASDVWDRKRNAWQNYYNHGIHVTGDSLNPIPGTLVNNGTLRLYPLIADSTHVTVMMDATNNLYKLAPDGTYHVLSNTYELFHDIDDSMYIVNGTPKQGYNRNHVEFKDNIFEQVELARAVLLHEVLLGQTIANTDFFNMTSTSYDQTPTSRQDDAELQESINYEQSRAESMLEYYFHIRDDGD